MVQTGFHARNCHSGSGTLPLQRAALTVFPPPSHCAPKTPPLSRGGGRPAGGVSMPPVPEFTPFSARPGVFHAARPAAVRVVRGSNGRKPAFTAKNRLCCGTRTFSRFAPDGLRQSSHWNRRFFAVKTAGCSLPSCPAATGHPFPTPPPSDTGFLP